MFHQSLRPCTIVEIFFNSNYTVTGKHGKVRAPKVCANQVKKYFEKELVISHPNMSSKLSKAPEDVPPAWAVPVPIQASSEAETATHAPKHGPASAPQLAAEAEPILIEPSMSQSSNGCPLPSAILKQAATLDFSPVQCACNWSQRRS